MLIKNMINLYSTNVVYCVEINLVVHRKKNGHNKSYEDFAILV